MTYNLISNSRQGRKTEVIHIADLGCSALARAKNPLDMPNLASDDLSEAIRVADRIAAAFLPVTVCRKCRSAARQILAIQKRRTEKLISLTCVRIVASWEEAVQVSREFTDASSEGITYWAAEDAKRQYFVGMTKNLGHHRPQIRIRLDKVLPATMRPVAKA